MNRSHQRVYWAAGLAVFVLIATPESFAQQAKPATQPTAAAPAAQPASPTSPVTKTKPPFKEEELASLLAPIALYPDSVVTQILIASTYPLEVVEANRWIQQKKSMKPDDLAKAAEKQPWDASVQGLCAIPDVLKMMDEKLDWTQKVGDAFLAQQKEVMAMIQTLRTKAKEAGNLKSDEKMKVTTEPAPADAATKTEVIVIESADPQVIYVPTYSPTTIYGYWGYPSYPPYYWPPPVGYPGSGFWWGVGIGISIGYWGGHYNNCYPDWHGGDINIGEINIDRGDRNQINGGDRNRGNAGDRGASAKATDRSGGSQKWSHNPDHRKGVSYRDNATASKFDRAGSGAGASSRDAYRGRSNGGASASTSDWRGGGAGASAGTRDLGGSSGTRNLSGGAGASAGTRDLGSGGGNVGSGGKTKTLGTTPAGSGSSSRGGSSSSGGSSYSGGSRGGSSSSAFGGMNSGSRASSYSSRGGMSRGGGGGGRRR